MERIGSVTDVSPISGSEAASSPSFQIHRLGLSKEKNRLSEKSWTKTRHPEGFVRRGPSTEDCFLLVVHLALHGLRTAGGF